MTSPPIILQFVGGLFLFLAKVDSGGAWHHSATNPLGGSGCRLGRGSALPRESGWSGTATRSCSADSRSRRLFSCRPHILPCVTVAFALKTDREEAVGTESGGTGNVRPELFADDFFFKDPDVQLRGIQKYAEGVRRLFDQETSRAEIISCALDPGTTESVNASQGGGDRVQVVSVRWRLSGRVNIGPVGLNIKPYIVTSDLHVREGDGLVVFQEDTFDIPGWDLLLSSFAPWLPFLAPPAPPVSEMPTETV